MSGVQDGMAELRRRVVEKEGAAEAARAEAGSLRRQVEAGQREAAAARQAHSSLEQQLHSQLAALRSESEAASRALTTRLESATEQSRRWACEGVMQRALSSLPSVQRVVRMPCCTVITCPCLERSQRLLGSRAGVQ